MCASFRRYVRVQVKEAWPRFDIPYFKILPFQEVAATMVATARVLSQESFNWASWDASGICGIYDIRRK